MRRTTLKEDFNEMDNILKGIKDYASPVVIDDRLSWLTDRDFRYKLFEKNPDCFICIGKNGYDIPLFPICNRMAIEDPTMVEFSMKLAKRMKDSGIIDRKDISRVIAQLTVIKKQLGV